MPSSSGRHSIVFNLFSKNSAARVKSHCPYGDRGYPFVSAFWSTAGAKKPAKPHFTRKEIKVRRGGLCDLPRVTRHIVGWARAVF